MRLDLAATVYQLRQRVRELEAERDRLHGENSVLRRTNMDLSHTVRKMDGTNARLTDDARARANNPQGHFTSWPPDAA